MPVDPAGNLYRRDYDGSCRYGVPSSSQTDYPVGRPASASAFPIATEHPLGTGRLRAPLHGTSDGIAVRNASLLHLELDLDSGDALVPVQPAPFEFLDTMQNARCAGRAAVDGTQRCIPTNVQPALGYYYADSACSDPVHLASGNAACPTPSGFVSLPPRETIAALSGPITELRAIGPLLRERPTRSPAYRANQVRPRPALACKKFRTPASFSTLWESQSRSPISRRSARSWSDPIRVCQCAHLGCDGDLVGPGMIYCVEDVAEFRHLDGQASFAAR
jgi:hypothetical protein